MPRTLALELSPAAYAMMVVIAGGILWLIVYAFREQRRPNERIVDPSDAQSSNLRAFDVSIRSDDDAEPRWITVRAASEADAIRQVERFGDSAVEARPVPNQD